LDLEEEQVVGALARARRFWGALRGILQGGVSENYCSTIPQMQTQPNAPPRHHADHKLTNHRHESATDLANFDNGARNLLTWTT
jgi:hypothetical protein